MTKPLDYDAYWKSWLKVCIEGIIRESAEREQRSNHLYNPLDQEYHESVVNN
jgi:hypothetical protein